METPAKTLYSLLTEHSDQKLKEGVRALLQELREEINLPDDATKLETLMERA